MNTFEPGVFSPLSTLMQETGNQQPSMGTPRPGTPRGSHFRLSPDGTQNPGTPGAASHDHHKYPNSPWSGSEPATPGSGYRNAVVPNSPYLSSYPNTPATPGGGGFYQKPVNNMPGNTTAVPPGSPWTDRSVCTPGPLTPMTPATPMHSNMSDYGSNASNGSFGNGSPTFPLDSSSMGGKPMPQYSGLAALLQDTPSNNSSNDPLLPLSVLNHNQPPQNNPPVNNGNGTALPSTLPPISDIDISLNVVNNPNLISEFEDFFAAFMHNKNSQNPQPSQPQQHQQQPQPHMINHNVEMHNGGNMMYNNHNNVQGGGKMMYEGPHMNAPMPNPPVGPMRNAKFLNHNGGPGHPYMINRPRPGHFNNQYGNLAPPQPQSVPQHHPNPHLNNMNMMQRRPQFQGPNPSASVYAPPPSGNNGGYIQVLPPNHHNNMSAPPTYPPQNHWQGQNQNQNQNQNHQQPPQPLNNHNPNMMNMQARGIPQQPNNYFQNPVNSVNSGMDQLSNNSSVLPPTTFPYDLNSNGGGVSVGSGGNSNSMGMSPNPSAMSMNVQSPMSHMPPTPNPVTPLPDEALNIDLDGPYDGSTLQQTTWSKALDKVSRTNPVAEVGKVLFDDIFTDDEVIHCTLSGRGSTKKFNPNKVLYLKKAVAWLLTKPQCPWEFNVTTCTQTLGQDDESGVRGLEKKVFTEYRSRRRGDILKTRPAPPPTPT